MPKPNTDDSQKALISIVAGSTSDEDVYKKAECWKYF
jgi:hypothetical protein